MAHERPHRAAGDGFLCTLEIEHDQGCNVFPGQLRDGGLRIAAEFARLSGPLMIARLEPHERSLDRGNLSSRCVIAPITLRSMPASAAE